MFKRNKGYFLLTMLVLTGLAGRMHTTILTTKERHTLVTELKTSRNDFLKSVDGLSTKQLNFKANRNELSIKECIFKLVSIEKKLWKSVQSSMKQETPSLKRTIEQDEALPSLLQKNALAACNEIKFKSVREAMKFYKNERAQMLKYVHTSTQNVKGHMAATSFGNLDAYQLLLLTSIYSNYYTQQIEKIKAHPDFPK
jgi:hypothetical protein